MLKSSFFGHPVHIMLVHFPVAFLPLSAVLDLISFLNKNSNLAELAFYSSVLGVASGILASGFGAVDLIKIKNNHAAQKLALLHGGLNVLWLMIFGVIVGIQFRQLPNINIISIWLVLFKIISTAGLLYSNFIGGELVLRYGLGRKN